MRMKKTKIICTIGPSTESARKIKNLVKAGMNCARLNFSHGSYEHHEMLIRNIRKVSEKRGQPIAIIQDLQGPRLRLGELPEDGVEIKRGEKVVLVLEKSSKRQVDPSASRVRFAQDDDINTVLPTQDNIAKLVKKDEPILIKDGLVRLRAMSVRGSSVAAKVEQGGVLTSHRGINLPESKQLNIVITEKDKKDLKFGLKQKIDWIALSFVRDAKDINDLRGLLPKTKNYEPKIIAKIERKQAVENFDAILESADAIMVARGDLGIELPAQEIPLLQKQFIEKCLSASKPVIVATQMLESMTTNPRPTRAEVSDVANAVIDHTDAVMLSSETSTGKYPIATCQMMRDIIIETEESPYDDPPLLLGTRATAGKCVAVPKIISQAAEDIVDEDHIRAICVMSSSGRSARLIASERPEVPIIALTQNEVSRKQMCLIWGVSPYFMKRYSKLDDLIKATVKLVRKEFKIKRGEKILIASGHPTGPHGSLNLLKIHTV